MFARPFSLAIVPHAPLLLRAVAGESDPCAAVREAAGRLLAESADRTLVLVSPHAARTGVYATTAGTLSAFGIRGIEASTKTSERSAALAEGWGQPLLDGPVDHGALVPLALAPPGSTFLCCGIEEAASGETAVAIGSQLAKAVHSLRWETGVRFVASAHSAASLNPRAPLTERPEGAEFDAHLLQLLRSDPAALAGTDGIPAELWVRGGSCSQGAFAALGEMARLCEIDSFEILSHEWPVGVGLLVARSSD